MKLTKVSVCALVTISQAALVFSTPIPALAEPAAFAVRQAAAVDAAEQIGRLAGYSERCHDSPAASIKTDLLQGLQKQSIDDLTLAAVSIAFDLGETRATGLECKRSNTDALLAASDKASRKFNQIIKQR